MHDGAGNQVTTKETREAVGGELDRLKGQLARTEILFVIDRTESMDDYWRATAETLRRLLDAVAKSDRSLAVGFCYSGDVDPATPQEGKGTVAIAVLFKRQMLALTAAVKAREPGTRAEYVQNADADRFLAGVLSRYEELEQRKAGLRVEVGRIATGQRTKRDDPELAAILEEEVRKIHATRGPPASRWSWRTCWRKAAASRSRGGSSGRPSLRPG